MSYAVRIEAFEGPLDLLLFLIRKNEMDIYDIPIARITQQYLDYIDVMKLLDLEVAGDFLLMAATLMQIKARMLLPTPAMEEEEDPRLELVRKLEEYQIYRHAAETLSGREEIYTNYYLRESGPGPVEFTEPEDIVLDVSLFDLLMAYQLALERVKEGGKYEVSASEVRISDQIDFLRGLLRDSERISLISALTELDNRLAMVMTLVAVLELARLGELNMEQTDLYGDIWLNRKASSISFQSGNA